MKVTCSLLRFPSCGALGREEARPLQGAFPDVQPSLPLLPCTVAPLPLTPLQLAGTAFLRASAPCTAQ